MWTDKYFLLLLLPIVPAIEGHIISIVSPDFENANPDETSSNTKLGKVRDSFDNFVKHGEDYAEKLRFELLWLESAIINSINELEGYIGMMPKEIVKTIEKKFRAKCYCNGNWQSPCSDECINSCYMDETSYNDCEQKLARSQEKCYCDQTRGKRCDFGIKECYQIKTVTETYKPPCVEHTINKTNFIKSFQLFSHLLKAPLEKLYHDIYFRLNKMENNLIVAEVLTNTTSQICDGEDTCFPEANTLLTEQAERYKEELRNMTLYLINAQNVRNDVNNNLREFKEQSLKQINTAIKNYACCLNGIHFNVTSNECNKQGMTDSTHATRPRISTVQLPSRSIFDPFDEDIL